jgi:8-oxo-dGTP pyrophosphatase MutT (NUDIX family)
LYHDEETAGFQRHVHACNNAALPGDRIPLLIDGQGIGWVPPRIVTAVSGMQGVECADTHVTLRDPSGLPGVARALSELGLCRVRGETFDVRAIPDGPVLAHIDRGAIPCFGIRATGVHVNGLVRRGDGLQLWIARRAMDKQLDPGKLDHIVAGGVPAGLSAAETLVKEAGEEAAIGPEVASTAVHVGVIGYSMERPEGLRRDWVHCYDLMLPDDFTPEAVDGEVESFELWPLGRAVEAVHDTDAFKFNVNLVLIDLFLRHGLIVSPQADTLRDKLNRSTSVALQS